MNIHEPLPRAAAVYVDFNQDFMHSRTGSIGIAVLVPLSISISISIRKIDIVEQYLYVALLQTNQRQVGNVNVTKNVCHSQPSEALFD
jgi:hypothetical protein